MPTENRSSNTEMVSAPRELIEFAVGFRTHGHKNLTEQKNERRHAQEKLRAILARPAEQHQVEPVPVLYYKALSGAECKPNGDAYSVYFVPMPGHQPLYAHADPGEVERLVAANTEFSRQHLARLDENQRLRAQQAERDALLRDLIQIAEDREQGYAERQHGGVVNGRAADGLVALLGRMKAALSASAELEAKS